jgi:xanthine dehydrogenase accessory factor
MEDIYEKINELLDKKEDFVLATILKKSISVSREESTKMIIKKDFSIIGTIGGGIFEAEAIKLSSKVFESGAYIIKKCSITSERAEKLESACGGDIKLLLEYVDYNDSKMVEMYKNVQKLKRRRDNFVIVTRIPEEGKSIKGIDKWVCSESSLYGEEDDKVQCVIRKIREEFKHITTQYIDLDGGHYLIEPVLNSKTLYIIGAGHVSQKIAEVTKILDFKTIVIDDRKEFANRERFKDVEEVKVVPSFQNILKYINVDNNSYIVIVTRGHAYDKEVLGQMLRTDAEYIGMIGSKTKREFVYNRLLNEGYTEEDLKRVHSPIGITIFAQTPEEIAISIAAELIKVERESFNQKNRVEAMLI